MKTTVRCIFGLIEFIDNKAIIYRIDSEEFVEYSTANEYCDKKISSGEHDSYVIPDLFYAGRDRGIIDFSFNR